MSQWLEASIEAARERGVPWDAQRAARVERSIEARRARSVVAAPVARLTLGGLASAALLVSVFYVSQLIRERGRPSEEHFQEQGPLLQTPAPEVEAFIAERPIGDGGFD